MPRILPFQLQELANTQAGVLSLSQLVDGGLSYDRARSQARLRHWQHIHPRVYATFSGQLPRRARLWAALLYGGEGSALSHETAAELWGFLDTADPTIHVTIPVSRRVRTIPDVRIHYAHRLPWSRHPTRSPSRIRVEDTVLDLIDLSCTLDQVISWITRACQRRRTTPERLSLALDDRKKIRWRREATDILADVSGGAETPLELGYVQWVERPHGLPIGRRQRHRYVGPSSQWSDVEYEEYALIVELDGRSGHEDDGAFRDRRRDNLSTARGRSTLRYGWVDVMVYSCESAIQIAGVLRRNGWQGTPRPCGPSCPVASFDR